MPDPKQIAIEDYTYPLPDERIARYPLTERDASRLLVYKEGSISEDVYRNVANHIPDESLLIFNNTKVVEARLLFRKPTGGVIEIFCLEPSPQYPDITNAMQQKGSVYWQCLLGGASKWKKGQVLEKKIVAGNRDILLQATWCEKKTGSFLVALSWSAPELSFAEILHLAGAIPLPPYLKRPAEEQDKERYQTIYAHTEGSVAAPTAGLHFTPGIFADLKEKKIQTDFLTLHVGAGTFQPVKSETMQDHTMHAEWIDVSRATIENISRNLDKGIIAVGTTSLRTIESLYWMGLKTWVTPQSMELSQWEAYELAEKNIPVEEALASLLNWMKNQKRERLLAKTQLLIAPGYCFKIIHGLVTNFHQPQSTLLLLVAALIGDDLPGGQAGWRKVYQYALEHDFRFLSYGDGSLLWRKET